MSKNMRRSARVQARIWIRVTGVEDSAQLRRGDVSLTGIFFETSTEIGPPGTVLTLQLMPFSRRRSIDVLARVVRVVAYDDIWSGRGIAGVALDFMADTPEKKQELHSLISEISGAGGQAAIPEKDEQSDPGIVLQKLADWGMIIETSWPVTVGETIRLEIQAPATGRRMRVHGTAQKASPMSDAGNSTRYKVEVNFAQKNSSRPTPSEVEVEGISLNDAMAVLLEETLVLDRQERPHAAEHLKGTLDRIQLTGLLGFVEMERLSGVLHIARSTHGVYISVHQGAVVKVRSDQPGTALEVLAHIMTWSDGDFDFTVETVDDEDEVQMSMTTLILELARLSDEASAR